MVFEDFTWIKVAVVIAVSMVLQDIVFNQIVLFGAHPDVMIVLPVTVGIVAGAEAGALIGFFSGVAADLLLPTPFGLSAFVFVLVGYGVGVFVNSPLGHDLYNARISGAAIGASFGTFLFGLIAAIIRQPGIFTLHLLVTLVVVGLGALLFAPLLFICWRWALSSVRALGFGPRMPSSGSAVRP
jgi:rod shape-determining protein MreD